MRTAAGRRGLGVRTRLTLWYTSVLLALLVLFGVLSYAMLRLAVMQDLDASLLLVAQVVRDTGYGTAGGDGHTRAEAAVRDILGPEFYDKFFRLVDPEGGAGPGSSHLAGRSLLLSDAARRNAARGKETFETVRLAPGEPVRLLTLPIRRDDRLRLLQVGMSLHRARRTLARYGETLLALIPLGIALAVAGGALIARAALRPVAEISRTARRITAEDLSERLPTRGTADELDHLADTLNGMLSRLENSFVELRRVAADAAHELRTPLTALRGEIEVALRAARPGEEYRRVLASSLEEVERVIRLAEDLLLLSRTSAGTAPVRKPVDLESLVLDVLDVGMQLARGSGVVVTLGPTAPAVVLGDAADLRRALLNLVENAVKYGAPAARVVLSLETAGGWAAVAVRDTGPGIPAADAERVFQPFVRLDRAPGGGSGAGLGLTIARSIAVAHGGTLALDSPPDGGARFTLRLPLA